MKKILLFTVGLLSVMLLPAQGVYQLWGMTKGGSYGLGNIFRTDAEGNNFNVVREFNTTTSGANPLSGPTEYNGKFYGMTMTGGSYGTGTIFEWNPATNTCTKKIDFNGIDGSYPSGFLSLWNGKFYGYTYGGGVDGNGVIFEWDPAANIYTKKIDFTGDNGGQPTGSLKLNGGKFFGTTTQGGSNNTGVIFEWDPATNIYLKKHDFTGAGGSYPSYLSNINGILYGIASGGSYGNGIIFEWNTATNVFTKKIDFEGANGQTPEGSLTLFGNKLYGITREGGNYNGGVIYEWDPATNILTKKIDFDNSNGSYPNGSLTAVANKLYGITLFGGDFNEGVIYEWDPVTNVFSKKFDMGNNHGLTGKGAYGNLTLSNGKLYGVAAGGSDYENSKGVLFEWDHVTNTYLVKIDFANLAGNSYYPGGSLVLSESKLYGITSSGGRYNRGNLFEIDRSTKAYTTRSDFFYNLNDTNSILPYGDLLVSRGKLYGISFGGLYNKGIIFSWDPITNLFKKFIDFSGTNGAGAGNLSVYREKFIITMYEGGRNNTGVIGEWDPTTNVYKKMVDFTGGEGMYPLGNMVLFNGKFYGMTVGGGNGFGVIYEWDPSANIYSERFNFSKPDGTYPSGSLTLYNGKFYSTTRTGGINDQGVIFEWDPATNIYTKKIDFSNPAYLYGVGACGTLTLSKGKFYGVTERGGNYDRGELFEWDATTNLYTKKIDFDGANGDQPAGNNLTLVPAAVSNGRPGSCFTFPSITINSSNNNQWVAITDEEGNAVAEIKANGNNLGIVTAAMFINNTSVREDANKKLYLDRNITITPQFQPATAVDIRLYIKGTEYTALKNAVNSNGQTSGIDCINDIRIYKVNSGCLPAVAALTNAVTTTAGNWENDYVLSARIAGFSSFYFAGKAAVCSAPVITQVHANPSTLWPPNHQFKNVTVNYTVTGNCPPYSSWLTVSSNEPSAGTGCGDAAPDWIIVNNHHLKLRAERAGRGNGRVYTITVNTKNAAGNIAAKKTTVTVPHHQGYSHSKGNYTDGYIDANGDYFDHWFDCTITPNPSSQSFNLQVATASSEKIGISIFDLTGRLIQQLYTVKNQSLRFGDHLKSGIYMITVTQGQQQQIIKVIKQ